MVERFDWRQERLSWWEERVVDSEARTGRYGWYGCPMWMERRHYRDIEGWVVAEMAKRLILAVGQVHDRQSTLRTLPKVIGESGT